MNAFWTIWIVAMVLLSLVTMYYVIAKLYRQRRTANHDLVVHEFDGIEERDGPVPEIVWRSYAVGLVLALGYFLYMSTVGEFEKPSVFPVPTAGDRQSLDDLLAELNPDEIADLEGLAANPAVVAAGQRVYQNYCTGCHRQDAQGQLNFPNLTDADWLHGSSDAQIWESIARGRKSPMPGWRTVLTRNQIDNLVDYVISLNPGRLVFGSKGEINSGGQLFVEHCANCHAAGGEGNQAIGAPNLTDDIWLYGGDKTQIAHTIANGLFGVMPAYETLLSRTELLSVAAYIKRMSLQALDAGADQSEIERGEYLARIGDCISCHTAAEGGEPMAGGLAFALPPMGTIHTTNISQQVNPGLGNYSYEEFYQVMKKGKGKHGYLYPAMPYTSFKYVTDEDIEAIWAYFQSVSPRDRANVRNTGLFSFDVRFPLAIWSFMFLGSDTLVDDTSKSARWNRGKYLVLGLGHCGECHTPRNLAQAMVWERAFQGNYIDGWQAPDISATMLYRQGWNRSDMATFLKQGYSKKGVVFGGMAEVVSNSTRHLTDEDALAIATYLLDGDPAIGNTLDPDAELIVAPGLTEKDYTSEYYPLFVNNCGACHGVYGEGREGLAPPLQDNSVFNLEDYYNSVAVVLRGISPEFTGMKSDDMAMVSFEEIFTDAKIAGLVTFLRSSFGGQPDPVTAENVEEIRRSLDKGGFTLKSHQIASPPESAEPAE
jgi:cbb3-type cytochrome c oxidase subunit III